MRKPGGLRRLGERVSAAGAGPWLLARLAGAWDRLLGPTVAPRLVPLAVRKGILVLGCPDPAYLSSLRASAAQTWPELRARIHRFTGLSLAGVRVEPCDPGAAPPPPPAPPADPFAEVLRRYRALRKEPLDSSRR